MEVSSSASDKRLSIKASSLYPKVIHRIIEGINENWLFGYDSRNVDSNSRVTNLPSVLIELGFDRLINCILNKHSNYASKDIINSYIASKDYDKALDILESCDDKPDISIKSIFNILPSTDISGSFIIRCAKLLDSFERNYSENNINQALDTLWEKKQFSLAYQVIKSCYPKELQPLLIIRQSFKRGANVNVFDIEKAIRSFSNLKDNEKKISEQTLKNQVEKLITEFIRVEKIENPFLIQEIFDFANQAFSDREDSKVKLKPGSELKDFLYRSFLELNAYDQAIELFKEDESCSYKKKRITTKMISDGKKNNNLALTKRGLKYLNQLIEEKAEENKSTSYHFRVNSLSERAKYHAEVALCELHFKNKEQAEKSIANMIEITESIALPPRECPPHHKIALRGMKRRAKKFIKRRFLKEGFFSALPKKNGWNTTVKHQDEINKKLEIREKKGENLEGYVIDYKQEVAAAEASRLRYFKREVIRINNGEVEEVFQDLKLDIEFYFVAQKVHWQVACAILEVDSSYFIELEEMLTSEYFKKDNTDLLRNGDWGGLAKFYALANRENVLTDESLNKLYEGLWLARITPEQTIPVSHDFSVSFVKDLVIQKDFEKAWKVYNILSGRSDNKILGDNPLRCSTHQVCLALLLKGLAQYNVKNNGLISSISGVGNIQSEEPIFQVQYRNTEFELRKLLIPSMYLEKKYRDNSVVNKNINEELNALDFVAEANLELIKYCNSPETLRMFVNLLRAGTTRTDHEVKNMLLTIYSSKTATERMRLRAVSTLIEMKIPGAEGMAELNRRDTQPEYTKYFLQELVRNETLHQHTLDYLTPDNKYLPFLKQLISEFQNEFNTVMGTLYSYFNKDTEIYDYKLFFNEEEREEEFKLSVEECNNILSTLRIIGILTPSIFIEAREADYNLALLKDFKKRVDELKKRLFSSYRIDDEENNVLLGELIYSAYKPANMSLFTLIRLCSQIQDCSHHLDRFKFSKKGYPLDLRSSVKMKLRQKGLALSSASFVSVLINSNIKSLTLDVENIRNTTRVIFNVARFKSLESIKLEELISIFSKLEYVSVAFKTFKSAKTDNELFNSLMNLQEVFGIFLEDNLESAIISYLASNKKYISKMLENIANSLRSEKLKRLYLSQCKINLDENLDDLSLVSKAISIVIIQKLKSLTKFRSLINDDLNMFVTESGEVIDTNTPNLVCIISKNLSAFFGKASAGICTDGDIALFHREDHFHINIVDNDNRICVGNVMAYIKRYDGRDFLLLRGFNPSVNLLEKINVESFCEAIISIGIKFARENNLDGLMLSQQGSFLALSNRSQIAEYLDKKYKGKGIEFDEPYKIASSDKGEISKGFLIIDFKKDSREEVINSSPEV